MTARSWKITRRAAIPLVIGLLVAVVASLLYCFDRAPKGVELASRATVVVLAASPPGPPQVMGCGFLVAVQGRVGYVFASDEVALLKSVEIVLDARTRNERRVPATVVENTGLGFVVLKLEADGLPAPIDPAVYVEPTEGSQVHLIGFWNGTTSTFAVGSGRVASTSVGRYKLFHVECEETPYLVGGPVVDSKGSLVGTSRDVLAEGGGKRSVCVAFPAKFVAALVGGEIASAHFLESRWHDNRVDVKVSVVLRNPLGTLRAVSALVVRQDRVPSRPLPDGEGFLGLVSVAAREVPLTLAGDSAVGEFELEDPGQDVDYLAQIKFVRDDGSVHYTGPETLPVETARRR